jgi:uncharacterized protein YwgA
MNKSVKLFASLSELGINPKMETFSERKRVQKTVYLLDKVFGMNFGYSYNWYLHGPYSPEVADIIFGVLEGRKNIDFSSGTLSNEDLRKIGKMKAFLGNDLTSNDTLELLVSVHFLLDCTLNNESRKEEIIKFLNQKKPYFTNNEINAALKRMQTLRNE